MLPPEQMGEATWRNARGLLDHRFTSVYSAGALAVARRSRNGGSRQAPARFAPRPFHGGAQPRGEGTGDIFNGRAAEATRGFVLDCAELGVQSVKLVILGENPRDGQRRPPASSHQPAYAALPSDLAQLLGDGMLSLEQCFQHRQQSLEQDGYN